MNRERRSYSLDARLWKPQQGQAVNSLQRRDAVDAHGLNSIAGARSDGANSQRHRLRRQPRHRRHDSGDVGRDAAAEARAELSDLRQLAAQGRGRVHGALDLPIFAAAVHVVDEVPADGAELRIPAHTVAPPAPPAPPAAQRRVGRVRWFDVARKYGFIVPLDGAPDVFLHLRDLEPGVAEALEELAVVSYDVVPYRDKTKAVRLQVVDAAAYAQLVLENQGRTLSVQDAAVELGRLRAIPLPPRAGEDPTRV